MDETLNHIIGMILQLSEKETHPDKVSCIHAALMRVNIAVGKEMLKIREDEKA